MKILWFTNTPSLYKKNDKGYNGGGWIESLEKIVSSIESIELGVSFFHNDDEFKVKANNTCYYPIPLYNSKLKKLKHWFFYKSYDDIEVEYYLKVIADFQPDIIHIFGTERSFGLLNKQINIPIVVHIQGLLNPCLNAYFSPSSSKIDFIIRNLHYPIRVFNFINGFHFLNHNTNREVSILENCTNFMGRTGWDFSISKLYAPQSNYYFCSEILRDSFYNANNWVINVNKSRKKIIIISTISKTEYKGYDVILKTAKLLTEKVNFNFEWRIFGISEYNYIEKKLHIRSGSVNIQLMGVVSSETLVQNIQNADFFIHPSYIDNSPNSVCEAQMIGIPVIATNVGGIPSLIEDGKTGYLIPANDPFSLAARIIELKDNPQSMVEVGKNARECALNRHNKETILSDLFAIYNDIYEKSTNGIV